MTKPLASIGRDALITLALAVLALLALSGASYVALDPQEPRADADVEIERLKNRDVVEYEVFGAGEGAVVRYSYVGKAMPKKLADNELTERRSAASWTKLLGVKNEGTPEETLVIEQIFYPQPAFVQDENGWHYLEYDTIPKSQWDQAYPGDLFSRIVEIAHAASATIYSGAGDGYVLYGGTDGVCSVALWDTAHDAATGTNVDATAASTLVGPQSADNGKFQYCSIYRGFFPFDTSSLPATSVVSAATLNVKIADFSNEHNDGSDYLTVVRTSQATHTTLALADYDQAGAINNPTEGIDSGQRKDITSLSLGYITFTLNATGRSWIAFSGQASNCSATAGITCLGLREGHDTTDTRPTNTGSANGNAVTIYTSEQSGTSEDPYLSITYEVSTFSFWQFQDY